MLEGSDDQSRFSNRVVNGGCIDVSAWPTPDEGALTGDLRTQYFARKTAVLLHLRGASPKEIWRQAGLSQKQAYRLIRERCLQVHSDGQPYGFRGLIPYLRIKPYTRSKPLQVDCFGSGASGALELILDIHPD